jgi:hypothetical protein
LTVRRVDEATVAPPWSRAVSGQRVVSEGRKRSLTWRRRSLVGKKLDDTKEEESG